METAQRLLLEHYSAELQRDDKVEQNIQVWRIAVGAGERAYVLFWYVTCGAGDMWGDVFHCGVQIRDTLVRINHNVRSPVPWLLTRGRLYQST